MVVGGDEDDFSDFILFCPSEGLLDILDGICGGFVEEYAARDISLRGRIQGLRGADDLEDAEGGFDACDEEFLYAL